MTTRIRASRGGVRLATAWLIAGLTLLLVSLVVAQDSPGTTKARLHQTGTLQNPRIMGLRRPQATQSSQPQVPDEEDSVYLRFPSPGTSQASLPPPTVHRSPPVVVSRAQRNLLWVLAAEGDETEIYAADMSGRDLGTWRLDPALYSEWTALAMGRCDQKTCLYVGDLGDSLGRRGTVQLYRFEEPLLAFDRIPRTYSVTGVQKLIVGYPDGAHDARALVVNADGTVLIVTSGFDGKSRLYSVSPDAWNRGSTRIDARGAGNVAVNLPRFGALTGITRTGGGFVARTANSLAFLTRGESGMVPDPSRPVCVLPAGEQSGLGVDWLDNRRFIISTVQGFNPTPTLSVVECPES